MAAEFPHTIVVRHRKENVKKCSLRYLEERQDFIFYSYPLKDPLVLKNHFVLTLEAPPLSKKDLHLGIFLLDATWRYAAQMGKKLLSHPSICRSIPPEFRTAYPRYQTDCPNPMQGLASVEALYIAYSILERDTTGILQHYYWKEKFLEINAEAFQKVLKQKT